jgi:hypothetical protein
VGVTVAVVPGLLVGILAAWGNQSVQELREISLETWLEFD